MFINIEIRRINTWYSEHDKKWFIDVSYFTDNVGAVIRYSSKKLNKAKKQLWKNLHKDILKEELNYRMKDVFEQMMLDAMRE